MRIPALFLVLGLTVATDFALRPLWDLGTATPDPVLLLVLWFALHDRRRRVHVLVAAVALGRSVWGLTPLIETWSLLALIAEVVLMARHFFDLRPPYFRYPTLALIVSSQIAITHLLLSSPFDLGMCIHACQGGVVSALLATLFFPVLYTVRPLLRSPEYPLVAGAKR